MERILKQFQAIDIKLFHNVNRYFEKKLLNIMFRTVTHAGGAMFTIFVVLILLLFGTTSIRTVALASALSLTVSHLPVAILKKAISTETTVYGT